ncbi:hypothetical protein GCM10023403_45430 [Pseudonocardia benzenivorans]
MVLSGHIGPAAQKWERSVVANEDVARLSVVGDVIRGRWRGLLALAVAGAVLGFGASFVLSPGQQATGKVLVQGQRTPDQLLTETQIATSLSVADQVAAALNWGRTGAQLQQVISAAVSDGNVIDISGVADTPADARRLADEAAKQYVAFSAKMTDDAVQAAQAAQTQQRATIQKRIDDLDQQIARAGTDAGGPPAGADANAAGPTAGSAGATDTAGQTPDQLRAARAAAQSQLEEFDRQAAAGSGQTGISTGAVSILEAAQDRGAAAPSPLQLTAGGALVAAVGGLLVMLWARRRTGRVGDPDIIESALGAGVVSTVTVVRPDADATGPTPARHGLAGLLRTLFSDRSRWELDPLPPGRTDDERTRYRRALARLLGEASRSRHDLLAVVAADDLTAVRAVAEFVVTAQAGLGEVGVVTDSDVVRAQLAAACDGGPAIAVADDDELLPEPTCSRFRIVTVDVDGVRPSVPDTAPVDATVVVTTVGVRSATELSDIAGAVLDAGHVVTGVLLVRPRRAADPEPEPEPEPEAAPAPEVAASGNGHTNGVPAVRS